MFIFTYRYLRRKFRERKAAKAATAQPNAVAPGAEPEHSSSADTPGLVAPRPQASNRAAIIKTAILAVGLAIPIFLETLDYTIVATAQAHIASIFNHLELQSYIGTVYLLTSTVFLPLFASLADIFGRHWTLQLALLLFMVGSAISTGSNGMPTMLAGRGVAGIGGAGLLACVRIILADSSSLDTNNWQQTAMFLLYTLGFCLGPFIGGSLLTVSFRWVFAINLPFSAVAMVVAFFLLRTRTKKGMSRELPGEHRKESFFHMLLRVDWIGAVLFMAGGILLLLALNWGSSERWNEAKVIASFVVGGVLFIVFVIWEIFLERFDRSAMNRPSRLFVDPMIPVSLFKSYDVCVVQYATFVTGIIMLVMFYFVAIFSTVVNDLDPDKAGAQLIYFAPGMGGGSLVAITFIRKFRQPKYPIIFGGVVESISLGLISWAMTKDSQRIVNGFMAMAGVGVGLSIGPLAVHARFSQPEHLVAVVAALTLFFRSFGGTVGLAQCGAVLNARVNHYIANAIATGQISSSASLSSSSASFDLSSLTSISLLPPDVQDVVRDAFRDGLKWSFISLIPWAGLATVLTVFLSHIKDRKHLEGVDAQGAPIVRGEVKESVGSGFGEEKPEVNHDGRVPSVDSTPKTNGQEPLSSLEKHQRLG